MKHMKKALIGALAVMALSASVLVGCGGSAPASAESIDGTSWKIASIEGNNDAAMGFQMMEGMGAQMELTFDGGKVAMHVSGNVMGQNIDETEKLGTYETKDGKLVVEGQEIPINGNKMTLTADGVTMVLEKK